MSCLPKNYNPIPPREWNRFTRRCDVIPLEKYPLDPATANLAQAAVMDVYKKGLVLQYKKNSALLTKNQTYSQIAKGQWTNRTTTWATQTDAYTNPNINCLLRTNYTYATLSPDILDINLIEEVKNVLCSPSSLPANNPLPVQPTSTYTPPFVLPPPAVGPGPSLSIPPQVRVPPTIQRVLPTGGNLVCNTIASPCNDNIREIFSGANRKCYPTTDSNVPGPIVPLCWNSALPTYYPRQRYTYGISSNKFPVNSKAIVPVT